MLPTSPPLDALLADSAARLHHRRESDTRSYRGTASTSVKYACAEPYLLASVSEHAIITRSAIFHLALAAAAILIRFAPVCNGRKANETARFSWLA